jgi:hypothetical protein
MMSNISIYAPIYVLYGQNKWPIMHAGIGTYIVFVSVTFEIVAGVISRRKPTNMA